MTAMIAGLLVLLLGARLFGEAAERLGQPAILGELTVGILAGVAIALFGIGDGAPLGWLRDAAVAPEFKFIADAGVFFLMLMAGIDLKPREIAQHGMRSFAVATGGVLLPLAAGTGFALMFLVPGELQLVQALFVGVTLAITAVPTVVKVLADMGLMHSKAGETIVAAAIFDDVLGLVLLAVLTALMQSGATPGAADLALLLGKVGLFFVITILLGVHVFPRISARLQVLQIASAEFGILMVVALAYALLAEALGMHWIMGAFMAGLYFEPQRVGARAYAEMRILVAGVTSGFLAPMFFVAMGLAVDLSAVAVAPVFCLGIIAIAVVTKLVGAGLPAYWAGLGARDAMAVGAGMTVRGGVGIAVIAVGIESGLFTDDGPNGATHAVTSALVVMAIVTTLLAPPLLKWILRQGSGSASSKSERG